MWERRIFIPLYQTLSSYLPFVGEEKKRFNDRVNIPQASLAFARSDKDEISIIYLQMSSFPHPPPTTKKKTTSNPQTPLIPILHAPLLPRNLARRPGATGRDIQRRVPGEEMPRP